jgi:ribosomal protein L40E
VTWTVCAECRALWIEDYWVEVANHTPLVCLRCGAKSSCFFEPDLLNPCEACTGEGYKEEST